MALCKIFFFALRVLCFQYDQTHICKSRGTVTLNLFFIPSSTLGEVVRWYLSQERSSSGMTGQTEDSLLTAATIHAPAQADLINFAGRTAQHGFFHNTYEQITFIINFMIVSSTHAAHTVGLSEQGRQNNSL